MEGMLILVLAVAGVSVVWRLIAGRWPLGEWADGGISLFWGDSDGGGHGDGGSGGDCGGCDCCGGGGD